MNEYTLKDLIKINNGKDYRHLAEGDIPVYGSGGIMCYVDEYLHDGECILLPRKGTLDNIMYVTGRFWTVDTMYWATVNNELADTRYLYLYLTQLDLSNLDTGSTLPSMTNDTYNMVPVKLPDIDTQHLIADKIFAIREKIANNTDICSDLESMSKLLYDYWFVQFDFPDESGKPYKSSGGKMVWNKDLKREIPEGWVVKRVLDYCDAFTGKKDVNQASDNGKYKFYSCAPEYRYSNEKIYEGKAILISGNGSYTGRTVFVNDAFDLYQRTYACVPLRNDCPLEYIYYSMLRYFVPVVSGGTHGSAIPYIVLSDITEQTIIMDQRIVDLFNKTTFIIQERIIELQKENQQLASLRDFILPMLMNGQVEVG